MARRTRQEIALGLIALAVLKGCVQPPTEQLSAAQHSVGESAGPVAAEALKRTE